MSQSNRIQMKIGDAEFVAEGSEEAVDRRYQQFLEALAARASTVAPRKDDTPNHPAAGAGNGNGGNGATSLPAEIMHQAFIIEGDDVTLRALPQTDDAVGDAIVLLLYGYRRALNKLDVNAVALTESVRASGIQATRLDRIILSKAALIRRAGAKRGTRYSLNNQGIASAEKLLHDMYA